MSRHQLSAEERKKLEAGRKELSLHERARLSDFYLQAAAGVAWLDLGEVSRAVIEIDDRSSPEREMCPYAHIYFSDYYRRRVETFDIHESVKSDPTAIGHPAIVFAIYHWQQVIYTKRVIEREDVTWRGELGRFVKDEYGGGKDVRSAESNLKKLSKTLYDGAKKRMIPKESALALKMQWCGLWPEGNESVVYKAWEALKAESICKQGYDEDILKDLEPKLLESERVQHIRFTIYACRVMEFLRENGERGGRRFVAFDAEGNSFRPTWKNFRNAFAAWFFNLEQSVVQQYLEVAGKQDVVLDQVYEPSLDYPKTTVFRIFLYLPRQCHIRSKL